jgi:hypothetical protein
VAVVPVCHAVRVRWGLDAASESVCQFHAGGMAAASLDVSFPVGNVMMELQYNHAVSG